MINPFKKLSYTLEAAEAYLRTTQLLLQAIGLHAIEGDPQEYATFRTTIEGLQSKVAENTPLAEGLLAVGAAAKAMHDYGIRTTRFIKAQSAEWQELVRMLIGAIDDLDPTAAQSTRLRDINWKIGKAVAAEEIRDLRKTIAEYLEAIRNEITRTSEKSTTALPGGPEARPDKTIGNGTTVNANQQPNSVAGLPARPEAEAAIHECRRNGNSSFAVLFVIDRLRYVNSRFGGQIGERITALFLERLVSALSDEDRLFRWGESSFISLLENRDSEGAVRRQIERILFKRLVESFTIKDQSVMLPISATWTVVPIAEMNCEAIVSSLDSFVAQNTR